MPNYNCQVLLVTQKDICIIYTKVCLSFNPNVEARLEYTWVSSNTAGWADIAPHCATLDLLWFRCTTLYRTTPHWTTPNLFWCRCTTPPIPHDHTKPHTRPNLMLLYQSILLQQSIRLGLIEKNLLSSTSHRLPEIGQLDVASFCLINLVSRSFFRHQPCVIEIISWEGSAFRQFF